MERRRELLFRLLWWAAVAGVGWLTFWVRILRKRIKT